MKQNLKILIITAITLGLTSCEDDCTNDIRVFQVTTKGDVELFVNENVTMDCDVALPFTQNINGTTWRYELK